MGGLNASQSDKSSTAGVDLAASMRDRTEQEAQSKKQFILKVLLAAIVAIIAIVLLNMALKDDSSTPTPDYPNVGPYPFNPVNPDDDDDKKPDDDDDKPDPSPEPTPTPDEPGKVEIVQTQKIKSVYSTEPNFNKYTLQNKQQ